jgi:hypothetical protein
VASREFIDRVNALFNVRKILSKMGIRPRGGSQQLYCPFHPDEEGGKVSAKLYDETNSIYCFGRCRKPYRAYDLLRLGGATDSDIFKVMRARGVTGTEIEPPKRKSKQLMTMDKAMEWRKELITRHKDMGEVLAEMRGYLKEQIMGKE